MENTRPRDASRCTAGSTATPVPLATTAVENLDLTQVSSSLGVRKLFDNLQPGK